jgi:uncharacterized membrane protein
MELVPIILIGLYVIGAIASLIIIIALVAKRINDKKQEQFEDRSN